MDILGTGRPWTRQAAEPILDCMVSQDFASPAASPVRPPAPLDEAAVQEALRPFGSSRMLPRAAYVDPDVFAWEKKYFFGADWMCVGRSSQTPAAGDMRAEPVGEGGVLLVRGDDGKLRAFANFCRHRGHELLPCGASAQPRPRPFAGSQAASSWLSLASASSSAAWRSRWNDCAISVTRTSSRAIASPSGRLAVRTAREP